MNTDRFVAAMNQYRKMAESGQASLFGGLMDYAKGYHAAIAEAADQGRITRADEQEFDGWVRDVIAALMGLPTLAKMGTDTELRALAALPTTSTLHDQLPQMNEREQATYYALIASITVAPDIHRTPIF